jgi:hypothetical protein
MKLSYANEKSLNLSVDLNLGEVNRIILALETRIKHVKDMRANGGGETGYTWEEEELLAQMQDAKLQAMRSAYCRYEWDIQDLQEKIGSKD